MEVSSIDSENTAKNLQVKDTTRDDSKVGTVRGGIVF